jgi:hypothetical protein
VLQEASQGVGLDGAEGDGVHPHLGRELVREQPCLVLERRLCRAVGDEPATDYAAEGARDVEDAPGAAFHHRRGHQAREQERSGDVEAQGVLEDPLARAQGRDVRRPTSVVDEDVHASEGVVGGGHEALEIGASGHIAGHGDRAPAACLHLGDNLGQVARCARGDHHVGADLGEPDGDAPADALTGPGDEGDRVVEAKAVQDHRAASGCWQMARRNIADPRPSVEGGSAVRDQVLAPQLSPARCWRQRLS